MYVTSFWFHSKLVLEKAKKPDSYELTIHAVSFLLSESFGYFQMNILTDRLHSTKFSIATRDFYIWKALCRVKYPCKQVFQKTFLFDSAFQFAFALAFSHRNFFPAACYLQWENVC